MNASVIGIIAFASIFGSSLLGMRLHSALPNHHFNTETNEVVRLGMRLTATMTALLLGLMVASAKGSYDTQRSEVILIAGRIAFLDLFSPSNKIVIITMFVVALAVSSAIFLILELDRPFDGLIQISSAPMRTLLDHLGH